MHVPRDLFLFNFRWERFEVPLLVNKEAYGFYPLLRFSRRWAILHVAKLGAAVVGTFVALWLPFCENFDTLGGCGAPWLSILTRIFPFHRGIFEDKVANLWYSSSVILDWRLFLTASQLKLASLLLTLLLLAPSAVELLRHKPNGSRPQETRRMLLACFNSSMAFFLASFHVHEKTILLPMAPLTYLVTDSPWMMAFVVGLNVVSAFSCFPLLRRDGVAQAYWACLALFVLMAGWMRHDAKMAPQGNNGNRNESRRPPIRPVLRMLGVAFCGLSLACMFLLHLLEQLVLPPPRYPDLYPCLFSIFSCAHYVLAWAIGNYMQWTIELGIKID